MERHLWNSKQGYSNTKQQYWHEGKDVANLAIKTWDRIESIVIFQRVIKTLHQICELGSRGDSHPDSADSTSRRCVCSSYTASVRSPGFSRCRYHTLDTAWWVRRSRGQRGPCASRGGQTRDVRNALNGSMLSKAMQASWVSRQSVVKSLFSSRVKGLCSLWTRSIILGFRGLREVFFSTIQNRSHWKPRMFEGFKFPFYNLINLHKADWFRLVIFKRKLINYFLISWGQDNKLWTQFWHIL